MFQDGIDEVVNNPEKYGLQRRVEWSKEDEKLLDDAIQHIRMAYTETDREKAVINWLKSLRP